MSTMTAAAKTMTTKDLVNQTGILKGLILLGSDYTILDSLFQGRQVGCLHRFIKLGDGHS